MSTLSETFLRKFRQKWAPKTFATRIFCPDCRTSNGNAHPDDVSEHFVAATWKVSTQNANGELDKILDTARWEWLVEGWYGFVTYLQVIHEMSDERNLTEGKVLDLIDHSQTGNVLALGGSQNRGVRMSTEWLSEGENSLVLSGLRQAVQSGVVTGIRLLGCGTASQGAGYDNIVGLSRMLGTTIWGTARIIDHRDFDEHGFTQSAAKELVRSP